MGRKVKTELLSHPNGQNMERVKVVDSSAKNPMKKNYNRKNGAKTLKTNNLSGRLRVKNIRTLLGPSEHPVIRITDTTSVKEGAIPLVWYGRLRVGYTLPLYTGQSHT